MFKMAAASSPAIHSVCAGVPVIGLRLMQFPVAMEKLQNLLRLLLQPLLLLRHLRHNLHQLLLRHQHRRQHRHQLPKKSPSPLTHSLISTKLY